MKRVSLVLLVFLAAAGLAWRAHRGPGSAQLLGLWRLGDPRAISDELVFYYFHEGGKGLYRYGQVGHNQTHSFDWKLDGRALSLVFRKTGEHAQTRFVLGESGGNRTLTLLEDPRAQQPAPARVRYTFTPTSLAEPFGPLFLDGGAAEDGTSIAGRMWIDLRRYATGGVGFRMYQLSEHVPDGWKPGWRLGWHHQGDFDDWTTETLGYVQEPGALRLRFLLRGDELATPIEVQPARDKRALFVARDPRNFLHVGRFVDAGRSF